MVPSTQLVPDLLASMAKGDESAAEKLFPLVYDELHRLASQLMSRERRNHTLQPTALIHEAWLRLAQPRTSETGEFDNVNHFIATAAVVMRRILVNHAKARSAAKRGGGAPNWQFHEIAEEFEDRSIDLIALDDALELLKARDPIQFRLVELRFFGGMSFEQCAEILECSPRTLYYEWAHAKAWLRCQLEAEE